MVRLPSSLATRCFKCHNDSAVIATREGPKKSYCIACFIDFTNRTVRDALFRQCLLPPNVPVVVCVSGGANSMALMHLMGVLRQTNLQRGGNGRIVFHLKILHLTEEGIVEEMDAMGAPGYDHRAIAEMVVSAAARPSPTAAAASADPMYDPHNVIVKSMRDVLAEMVAEGAATGAAPQPCSHFVPLGARRAPLSDVEEEYLLRKRMALSYAARKYCLDGDATAVPLLVFGENGVGSCTRALGDLVRGKGAYIPSSSAFRGRMHGGAYVMRPLRGLLPKEVVMYNKLSGVPWATSPTPTTVSSFSGRSVNRILETFIVTLMQTYPSTPFNVLNSVTKLAPVSAHNPHQHRANHQRHAANAKGDMVLDDAAVGMEHDVGGGAASNQGSFCSSTATAASTQVKVILTKASQANLAAIEAIARDDAAAAAAGCGVGGVVGCGLCGGACAGTATSILSAVPTSEVSLCYGCAALITALETADGANVVCNLVTAGNGGQRFRLMDPNEVAASVAEFLL